MKQKKIFYEVIKTEERSFTDESDKKKFLDLVQQVKQKMELNILAFCITDDEGHFLVDSQSERKIALAAAQIMGDFSNYYRNRYQKQCGNIVQEMRFRRYMTEEEIVDSCLKLHLLPMKQKLVKKPEDYWWSSYLEYRRNYKRGIVNTEVILRYLDKDRKRAVRKFVCLHHESHYINELQEKL